MYESIIIVFTMSVLVGGLALAFVVLLTEHAKKRSSDVEGSPRLSAKEIFVLMVHRLIQFSIFMIVMSEEGAPEGTELFVGPARYVICNRANVYVPRISRSTSDA